MRFSLLRFLLLLWISLVVAVPIATAEPAANESSTAQGASLSANELSRLRKEAAHRHRRIIKNNDGNDALTTLDEPRTHENFLRQRTTALAGSQVDAIFYCTGVFDVYTHHSRESQARALEPRGEGDTRREDWAWQLGVKGPDTLATVVDFGHKHGIEVFWSMRMNDTHDTDTPWTMGNWKRQHPDCLMNTQEGSRKMVGARRWTALNYEMPEVREKVFRILRDVASRYDVDGLELDFMRSPLYFKAQTLGQPVTQENRDQMTDLLRRVRKMADQEAGRRGRPMLIAVRVPDSVGYASDLGLDVERWLADGLIDLLVVGCFYQLEPWETSVALGHKYSVPVYPSLSEPRFRNPQSQSVRESLECYRGRALDAWNAGVDGIYTFNYDDPTGPLWREAGDPETLKTLDQLYPAGAMGTTMVQWLHGGMKHMNRSMPPCLPEHPNSIAPGRAAVVPIRVAADPSTFARTKPSVQVRLLTAQTTSPAALEVRLNGQRLDGDQSESRGTPLAEQGPLGSWPAYFADPSILKQGVNRLEVAVPKTGRKASLLDAAILVKYSQPNNHQEED